MPKIVAQSISILSDAGLGMAMFSLGKYIHTHSWTCDCTDIKEVTAVE